jgi:electron transfer flavoprotein beta subunit
LGSLLGSHLEGVSAEVLVLKIVVPVKLVPDTAADKRIDPATKRLVRAGVDTVLNPFDEYAIEAGLQLRDALADGSTVTIVTMAPESGKEIVRKALAMGADVAVLVADAALEGADLWVSANVLAATIRHVTFDLVLCGTQTTDAGAGVLPAMLGELLGVPTLSHARELAYTDARVRVKAETERGYRVASAPLPALVSITKSANQPRYASLKGIMAAKKKEIRIMSASELGLTDVRSRTEVRAISAPPPREAGRTHTASDPADGARAIAQFLTQRGLL